METLNASLTVQLKTDLNRIRSCIEDFGMQGRTLPLDQVHPLAQADQSLQMLENWLLDKEQKQLLQANPWNVFLLYAAAYLCDLPIVESLISRGNADTGDGDTGESEAKRRQRFIAGHWKDLGIRKPAIAAAIAEICQMVWDDHNGPGAAVDQGGQLVEGVRINSALLSGAIRLARELNLKAPGVADRICALLPPPSKISMNQYNSAFAVTAIGPHPYFIGTIQVKIQCHDPEIHRVLKHHERAVQQTLQQINRHASPCFLYSKVIFEIEAEGYTPVDLKFSVDTSAALQLLTGNRLYSDNRVFLRELIQNAVDACNFRKRLEDSYAPSIALRFNEDVSIVTIRDNGIGMDRQWIEKYFLNVGISLYQSSEIHHPGNKPRIDFSFISQFGIGFLSSFLVADKIVIKTRKREDPGLRITITNLMDYFDVRPLNGDFAPGTEVSLYLKPSKTRYCRSMEYAGYLKTNLRFLDIPVQFHDQDNRSTTIGREKLTYENPKTADIDFIAPLEFKSSEGYLLLRARKHADEIYSIETALGGVSVFQDGIFVTQTDTLLPEGARGHVVGRINLRGADRCALSMDRNRIFWTDRQLLAIKKKIRMGLAGATDQFIAALDSQDTEARTRQSIINILAIFFDFNEVDDALHRRLCEPLRQLVEKKFRDFVRIHFSHTLRNDGIPEADGYGQQWQQRIIASFKKD